MIFELSEVIEWKIMIRQQTLLTLINSPEKINTTQMTPKIIIVIVQKLECGFDVKNNLHDRK